MRFHQEHDEPMTAEAILDSCPECDSNELEPADKVNDGLWDDTDTACHGCKRVFDARGRQSGGFDSDVAEELHSKAVNSLLNSLGEDS